jgi:hypothetical protein
MPTIVETVESPGGRWKAAIVRRNDGLLQVLLLKRTEPDAAEPKAGDGWAPQRRAAAFFDDIVAARKAAQELLAAEAGT